MCVIIHATIYGESGAGSISFEIYYDISLKLLLLLVLRRWGGAVKMNLSADAKCYSVIDKVWKAVKSRVCIYI